MTSKNLKIKIPDGKLLELSLEYDENDIIKNIIISGDFFMFPETGIEYLENFLKNKKIDDELLHKVDVFLNDNNIEVIGFSTKDLINLITKLSKK